ncbi:AsmA family protein [soil metagenome]
MSNPLSSSLNWPRLRERIIAPAGARAGQWRDWVKANDPVYTSFRRPGAVEKWTGAVVLLLVAAIVIFLLLFDWNWLRGPIGRWASAKYDREIALQGDLDVHLFSWTPSVTVRDLKFGGPQWSKDRDTADVGRIDASVRLRTLFAGQIEMPLLSIKQAEVFLIATKDGKQSWQLNPGKPDTGEGMKLPVIQQLVIQGGHIVIDEQKRGLSLDATVNAREAANDGDAGFVLDGKGAINKSPLNLRIEGGPFINIRRDRPYHFNAELAGAGSRLTADGSVTRPFDLGQCQATLTLQGQNLNDLYLLTGLTLPNTPAYRLSGALKRDDSTYTFNDFTGRVGASDLSGDVKVEAAGRLRVEAELASKRLDINDLTAILGAKTQTNAEGTNTTTVSSGTPGKLLPDATLQVDRLRTMDGTLTYRAETVKANAMDIRAVRLGAVLEAGVLDLNPVAFTFNRGSLNGTAKINATRDMPYSSIDFRLSGYPLESIVPVTSGSTPISGRALGRARLEGPGDSIHRFAAASKGSISLVVPQGEMRAAFAELLGINASAGLLKLLRGDQSTSPIRCAVADFNVANGVAQAQTFVIDTDVVLAKGSGSINLGEETLRLRIDGDSKKPRLLRLWTPINVSGPLTAPHIGVDTGQVIAQGGLTAVLGAVVAPLAALFAFVDPGLAKDANCGALIASAR